MGLFLAAFSWAATFVQICIITLAMAAALFYLAEVVEEYTCATKRFITWCLILSTVLSVGMWMFEDLSSLVLVVCLISNVVHYLQLASFPFFVLSSPVFIASVACTIASHVVIFQFFKDQFFDFPEVLAFFTLVVWPTPFMFFVSLSANDSVLPYTVPSSSSSYQNNYFSSGNQSSVNGSEFSPLINKDDDVVSSYLKSKSRRSGLLKLFDTAKGSILPTSNHKRY